MPNKAYRIPSAGRALAAGTEAYHVPASAWPAGWQFVNRFPLEDRQSDPR